MRSISPKHEPHRVKPLLTIIIASILVLTSCGGSSINEESSTGAAASQDVDPFAPEVDNIVTVGYPNHGATPLYAAIDQDIAAEHGLDITMEPGENGPAIMAQLVGGEVPIGGLNAFFTVPAVIGGADLRIIGEVIRGVEDSQTIEVLPDSDIDELSDFEDKKVAVVGLNSGHHGRLASSMLAEGLDPGTVEFVNLGWNEMPAALEQGTVDAVSVTGPAQLELRSELNTRKVFDYSGGVYEGFPDFQWVVSGEWADSNPNAVAAFQCAVVVKGAELITENDETYHDMLRELGYDEDAIDADLKQTFPAANDAAQMQVIPDIMYELDWINEEFDIADITVPVPDNC